MLSHFSPCNPMDYGRPRLLCPRILSENTGVPCSPQGISDLGLKPVSFVSCIGRRIRYYWCTWEASDATMRHTDLSWGSSTYELSLTTPRLPCTQTCKADRWHEVLSRGRPCGLSPGPSHHKLWLNALLPLLCLKLPASVCSLHTLCASRLHFITM